jgi:hypothetical protein
MGAAGVAGDVAASGGIAGSNLLGRIARKTAALSTPAATTATVHHRRRPGRLPAGAGALPAVRNATVD